MVLFNHTNVQSNQGVIWLFTSINSSIGAISFEMLKKLIGYLIC